MISSANLDLATPASERDFAQFAQKISTDIAVRQLAPPGYLSVQRERTLDSPFEQGGLFRRVTLGVEQQPETGITVHTVQDLSIPTDDVMSEEAIQETFGIDSVIEALDDEDMSDEEFGAVIDVLDEPSGIELYAGTLEELSITTHGDEGFVGSFHARNGAIAHFSFDEFALLKVIEDMHQNVQYSDEELAGIVIGGMNVSFMDRIHMKTTRGDLVNKMALLRNFGIVRHGVTAFKNAPLLSDVEVPFYSDLKAELGGITTTYATPG